MDKNGEFKHSFFGLWRAYVSSDHRQKKRLKKAIRDEIACQLNRFIDAVGERHPLRVDSHMHFHMIPFVFDALMSLRDEFNLEFVRNPYEIMYFSGRDSICYIGMNPLKNLLLNRLAKRNITEARTLGLQSNQYFIGVLTTGQMTYSSVQKALAKLKRHKITGSVDLLFHPGGVRGRHAVDWTSKSMFKEYYASPNRNAESEMLKSPQFSELIRAYENIFDH